MIGFQPLVCLLLWKCIIFQIISTIVWRLAKVPARSASPSTYHHFMSDCGCRISQCNSSLPDLSLLTEGARGQVRLYLANLELWVHHSLNDWLRANMERKDACMALAKVIDTYTSAASSAYTDMPEDVSLMLLTSIDLWVALDKCALHHYPLLHDYDPGFPPSLFEPLLLPRKAQMERLFRVEQYLATRRKAAVPGFPSIFQSVHFQRLARSWMTILMPSDADLVVIVHKQRI